MNINTNVSTVLTVERNDSGEECFLDLSYENATTLRVDLFGYEQDEVDECSSEFTRYVAYIEEDVSEINGRRFRVKYINVEDDEMHHFLLVADDKTLSDSVMYVNVYTTDDGEFVYHGEWFCLHGDFEKFGKFVRKSDGLRFLTIV